MGSADRWERAGRPGPVRAPRSSDRSWHGARRRRRRDLRILRRPGSTYQRPDPSIHDEVCDRLTRAGDLDASDLALAVSGVRDVVNDLAPEAAAAGPTHHRASSGGTWD